MTWHRYTWPSPVHHGSRLGWGFRIRTDSVEGRIRVDSGGFRAAPQGDFLAYFAVCMGILTPSKWIPDSDGFGRGSDSGGFGWIPEPRNWNPPTQVHVSTHRMASTPLLPPGRPRRVLDSWTPDSWRRWTPTLTPTPTTSSTSRGRAWLLTSFPANCLLIMCQGTRIR